MYARGPVNRYDADMFEIGLQEAMTERLETHMQLAIAEAKKAGQIDEVPVGAVIVAEDGQILAAAGNQVIRQSDPTAHAEILAIRKACRTIGNYRLLDTTLYVTIEPCLMCMGAIVHARIGRVVYGTADPKWGAAGSLYNFAADIRLNHQPEIISGICQDECRELMQAFFRKRR
jgi:tRNA(adenine34) deaminase